MAKKYTVQKGDTLGEIAKTLGTSVGNLSGFRSGNADLIFPGEEISIKPQQDAQATQRATTVRNELSDTNTSTETPATSLDDTGSSFGGFDFGTLQTELEDTKKKRDQAFEQLEGFRTNRYEELSNERGIDQNKEKISELDNVITQKKNERDQALAKIRSNPGASASTLAGEGKVASDLLNDEINNLIGQRNSLANEYNTELAEIDSIVEREALDLSNQYDYLDSSVSETQSLAEAYQEAILEELRREEDREFDIEDDLRDFEQSLELARQKDSGAGTNYTILTDAFGRPTVAIDKRNPTNQIDLTESEGEDGINGSVGVTTQGGAQGVDPALAEAQRQLDQENQGGGLWNWIKGLF